MGINERVDAIIASTSIPLVFPPVDIEKWSFTDGSIYSTVSIGDMISRCREDGVASDADIILDLVLCYQDHYDTKTIDREQARWMNALDYYKRRKTISYDYFY